MIQASHDPATPIPLAVYDVAARGWIEPREPMIGFAMLELSAGVGFIERLMIDHRFQRRGYGGALLDALVHMLPFHGTPTAPRRQHDGVSTALFRR